MAFALPTTSFAAASELPDIGSPADAVLPKSEEARLGRSIMREIRREGVIVDDPELTEYVQSLGHRLAAQVSDGESEFNFFVIDDPSINAFALPGGYIGVHTGLIAATDNESELAGVIAHEIAHVTQRHIARAVHANQRTSLIGTALMLGAVLVAAAADAGGDAVQAAVVTSQAAQIQSQINFTRSNEYEADRVGVQTLAAAGFNPHGMADFFGTLSSSAGPAAARVPEFLLTHPVHSARIAEARNRARSYSGSALPDTTGYGVARARVNWLARRDRNNPFARTEHSAATDDDLLAYEKALLLLSDLEFRAAQQIFERLVRRNPHVIAYRIGLAQSQAGNDDTAAALETFAAAQALFPRNVPLSVRYAQTLIDTGSPGTAHSLLLDLFNNVPPTTDQVRLIATAAIEAGDTAEAHYYMSEYNIMIGDLAGSITMLRRALKLPEIQPIQIARFEARIETVTEYLSDAQRRQLGLPKEKKPKTG